MAACETSEAEKGHRDGCTAGGRDRRRRSARLSAPALWPPDAHVPTSQILQRLRNDAPPGHVTLHWLLGRLRRRSFGALMLVLALLALLPGASLLAGVFLAFPAAQMILGHDAPHLPGVLSRRKIPTRRFAGLMERVVPMLRWIERVVRPRWPTPFETTKRAVGFTVLLLALSLLPPLPLSNIVPAFAIALLSLAYLEEDGLLLCIAGGVSLVSLAMTTAAVWGAVRTADWIGVF